MEKEKLTLVVGKRIAALRKAKGYSQGDLAEMLNYSHYNNVYKLESGKIGISIDMLESVCKVLDCTMFDLIGYPDNENYNIILEKLNECEKRAEIERTKYIRLRSLAREKAQDLYQLFVEPEALVSYSIAAQP
jgi:transcriptional regulator with XRE-family HTH domain